MPQSGCTSVLTAPPNNVVVTGAEVLSPSDDLQSKIRDGLKMFDHTDDKPGVVVYYSAFRKFGPAPKFGHF